jgi:ubiquinone/menaquinone biosynthesis C-methylase UbiE
MPFNPIARYYDQDDGRIAEDIPTILGFAQKTGGPVLDLGAGTGRLTLPLARAGYDVTGIDSAGEMLAIARRRLDAAGLAGRVTLVEMDFTQVELDQQFGLAYCGFNGFLHLIETEEQLAALHAWRRHLRPDGLLVIDVINPHIEQFTAADGDLTLADRWTDPASGHVIHKLVATEIDLADQIYTIHRFYDEIGADGVVRRTAITFETRVLFRRELAMLLRQSGYQRLQFYGGHDLGPWEADSPRIIAVARP